MMERLAGPRTCTYRFPGHFQNALRTLKSLSFEGLEKALAQAAPRMSLGNVIGVRETMEIVVASDFDAAIMDQARDNLREFFWRRPGFLYERGLIEKFGFTSLETPEYYLGALYELLPREIAVKDFMKDHWEENVIQAGRILLRFSAPEKAAMFIMKLKEADPKKTNRLLADMRRERHVCEYPHRRYELSDLQAEVSYLLPRPYLL